MYAFFIICELGVPSQRAADAFSWPEPAFLDLRTISVLYVLRILTISVLVPILGLLEEDALASR